MHLITTKAEDQLKQCTTDADRWLCCQDCRRFFHASELIGTEQHPRCPFKGCTGVGWNFKLFFWDTFRIEDDPRWPSQTSQLESGAPMPDPCNYGRAHFEKRTGELLQVFLLAPEAQGMDISKAVRSVRGYLWMLFCVSADPDDPHFCEELAIELVADVPMYCVPQVSAEETPELASHLQGFWRMAARTELLPNADHWLKVFADKRASAAMAEAAARFVQKH